MRGRGILELFSEVAGQYDSWYDSPAGRVVLEVEASMLDEVLPSGIGVDVGAGTCRFAPFLSRGREIVCLEPAYGMLVYGYARGRCEHPLCATSENAPLRPSFDFAYMVTVLEFLEDPALSLTRIWEALKSGGLLAVLYVERESKWGKLYSELAEKGADPVLARARFYSQPEVDKLLSAAGFEVREHLKSLDYEPLTVPAEKPRVYRESCADCGVTLTVAVKK